MQIELYEALISANVAPEKARAVTEAYRRETETKLATKDDLKLLASDTKVLGVELRTEMKVLGAELRTEIAAARTDIVRWLVGTQIALAALVVAGIKLIP